MGTGSHHSPRALVALTLVGLLTGACGNSSKLATAPQAGGVADMGSLETTPLAASTRAPEVSAAGSVKGAAGQMPAYYDGALFTINSTELPKDASASTIANNEALNEIFATNDLDDPQDFTPVISAIQGDGFNPLWRQILIVFNPGATPHQFFSDDEVEAAASGASPEITLVPTDEVYRCAVVGKK
jgi:hypothetical protein